MVSPPRSYSVFIKRTQEKICPCVSHGHIYLCGSRFSPIYLVRNGEIFKFSSGFRHPGENLTGYTLDRRLCFAEEISFLHLPGVEPRFFGLSVRTTWCTDCRSRLFIWTSLYMYIYTFVCFFVTGPTATNGPWPPHSRGF